LNDAVAPLLTHWTAVSNISTYAPIFSINVFSNN